MNQINRQKENEIINRYFCGVSVLELHRETGIGRTTIYRWLSETKAKKDKLTTIRLREYGVMKRRCERQEKIIEILQNSPCLATAPLKDRLNAIELLSGNYHIKTLCQAFNVAKGTYYNHALRNKKNNTLNAIRKRELTPIIEQIYHDSRQRFGAGKITAILKDRGYHVSEKYVGKIMHENGWFSVRTNAKKLYEISERRREDLVKQKFVTNKPNDVWVSDVTYFNFKERKYYICAILDLFSRKVIACKISRTNSTQLTKSTFIEAYNKRKQPQELIFHSDNGSNYISKQFMTYLKKCGVVQSFSRKGSPHDNAVCESFYKTLKAEQLYRLKIKSEKELKDCILEYIAYYNSQRPHTFLRYLSPDKFEHQYYKSENTGSD